MRFPKSMILCALAVSGLLTTCPAQESHLATAEATPRLADAQSNDDLMEWTHPDERMGTAAV